MRNRKKMKKRREKLSASQGRKAQESGNHFGVIIALVLGIIVIITVVFGAYNYKDFFAKFIPGFETVNETITLPTEDHVAKEEQNLETKKYPTVMIVYDDEGDNHAFTFRWNPNINKPRGVPQVVMDIDEGQYRDIIWRTDPRGFPVFSTSEVYDHERAAVQRIMASRSEEEMFREIADVVTGWDTRNDYYAFFPNSNYNIVPLLDGSLQAITSKEIQQSLYCIIKEVEIKEKTSEKAMAGPAKAILSDSQATAPTFIIKKKYEMTILGSNKCAQATSTFTIEQLDSDLQIITGSISSNYVILQDPFNIIIQSSVPEKISGIYKTSFRCISGCNFYSLPVQGFKETTFYFKLIR